ncbi:MAG: asparagine synthase-related protein, partial [Vicinamibacterales bacterium]
AGVFCAVHVSGDGDTVSLIGDRLGLRPIYYASAGQYVFFATALRILEALPALSKTLDVRGAIEVSTLGYPLSDRTPYQGIRTLLSGERIQFRDASVTRGRYWRLDTIARNTKPAGALVRDLADTLRAAIDVRLSRDRGASAFLSGGLDSRTIVALLRDRGVDVATFNFALAHTQDQAFGRAFADAVGALHTERPRPAGPELWSQMMGDAWRASPHSRSGLVERSGLVWSGDGGSVTLGHISVTPRMVELLRAGRRRAAVEEHVAAFHFAVPRRVLQRGVLRDLGDVAVDGLLDEMADFACEDEGRALWVWRMISNQRRHLVRHFEDLDLHRLEFHLPFYDGHLIDLVGSIPIDLCLEHRLYAALLPYLPASMTAAPWQAYPGALPCPVPVPEGLLYQWSEKRAATEGAALRRQMVRDARRLLFSPGFPTPVLRRSRLAAAAAIHASGLRDLGYVLNMASSVSRFWSRCEGRSVVPSLAGVRLPPTGGSHEILRDPAKGLPP